MSSGPTLTGETCIEVTRSGGYVNVQVGIEDWCTYEGECCKDKVILGKHLCEHCIYKKPVDVPAMIDREIKEKDKMNILSIIDQDDGSAIIEVEMTENEKDMFIEIGFLTALKEGMKTHEDNLHTPVPE